MGVGWARRTGLTRTMGIKGPRTPGSTEHRMRDNVAGIRHLGISCGGSRVGCSGSMVGSRFGSRVQSQVWWIHGRVQGRVQGPGSGLAGPGSRVWWIQGWVQGPRLGLTEAGRGLVEHRSGLVGPGSGADTG